MICIKISKFAQLAHFMLICVLKYDRLGVAPRSVMVKAPALSLEVRLETQVQLLARAFYDVVLLRLSVNT